MLDWIKNFNKDVPEFWKNYVSKFDKKSDRYVILSFETTGLNSSKDYILSMAGIAVVGNSILINDSFEVELGLEDEEFIKIQTEFTNIKKSEAEALNLLIDFIGNATLIGYQVNFDIEIINQALERINCGKLKNEAFDLEVMHKKFHEIFDKNFSLANLFDFYKIEKSDRNTMPAEAFNLALIFIKLKSRLNL